MERVQIEIIHFTLEDAVSQFEKIMTNYYGQGYTMVDGSGIVFEDFSYLLSVQFERKIDGT